MSDLISRQDAVALVDRPIVPTGDAVYDNAREDERASIKDGLSSLPSADLQPTCNQLATTERNLIKREDAIKCIKWGEGVTDVIEQIKLLPSADRPTVDKEYLIDLIQEAVYDGEACAKLMDMVDRPTGKWKKIDTWKYCSECGWTIYTEDDRAYNYCPNCGAKMKGETK